MEGVREAENPDAGTPVDDRDYKVRLKFTGWIDRAWTSRQKRRNTPLSLMIPQMIGFHRRQTLAASLLNMPATMSGGGAKTSGICEESTSSPSTFQRDRSEEHTSELQ